MRQGARQVLYNGSVFCLAPCLTPCLVPYLGFSVPTKMLQCKVPTTCKPNHHPIEVFLLQVVGTLKPSIILFHLSHPCLAPCFTPCLTPVLLPVSPLSRFLSRPLSCSLSRSCLAPCLTPISPLSHRWWRP